MAVTKSTTASSGYITYTGGTMDYTFSAEPIVRDNRLVNNPMITNPGVFTDGTAREGTPSNSNNESNG